MLESDNSRELWELRWVPHSEPIACFYDDENNAYLRQAFEDCRPSLTLPIMWAPDGDGDGGPPVTDPVTLYVGLPLSNTDNHVMLETSLANVVEDLIDGICNHETGKVEKEDDQAACRAVASRLRELADRLDSACAANCLRGR